MHHVALQFAPTVVFQPVQIGLSLSSSRIDVRVGQIEIAIAIDVNRSDAERIAMLVRNHMLGEAPGRGGVTRYGTGRVEKIEDLVFQTVQ